MTAEQYAEVQAPITAEVVEQVFSMVASVQTLATRATVRGVSSGVALLPPRMPQTPRRWLGQQRFDALPQPVRHDLRRLFTTPRGPTL